MCRMLVALAVFNWSLKKLFCCNCTTEVSGMSLYEINGPYDMNKYSEEECQRVLLLQS